MSERRTGKKKLLISLIVVLVLGCVVLPCLFLSGLVVGVYQSLARSPQSSAQTVAVPDVRGLGRDEAEERLKKSNLELLVRASRSDLEIPPGVVVYQIPAAGERVAAGGTINVVLSARQPAESSLSIHRGEARARQR